jgi:hypothetical protein
MFSRYFFRSVVSIFGIIWAGLGTIFLLVALFISGRDGVPKVLPLIFGIIGGVESLIGWILIFVRISKTRQTLALLHSGTMTQGKVTAIERDYRVRINGRNPVYLRYEFRAVEDGETHEGRSPNLPLNLEQKWSAGSTINVVYDSQNLSRSEADIFGVRQDA